MCARGRKSAKFRLLTDGNSAIKDGDTYQPCTDTLRSHVGVRGTGLQRITVFGDDNRLMQFLARPEVLFQEPSLPFQIAAGRQP